MKHKHAELIHAWADGAKIEMKSLYSNKWHETGKSPSWLSNRKYRIKTNSKPNIVRYCEATQYGFFSFNVISESNHNLKLTLDGDTGKLILAEVIK